ncbi:hypothetical protein IWX46DRAFT_286032 [Phyllosticta citricarpa]|uniref:Uncharacterized protein n=1 Tax=Phyllosticta citricarpa TaxID=55181 RepID=A0ABR1MM75_9PEZI
MIVKAQPSVQDRTGQPMFRSPNIKISAAKLAPHHIYTPQFHISGPEAIAMAEIANFVILHGGPGQCSLTHIYEPNEAAYTYVASAIAIAMKAFENEKLQYWLTKLAMEFDQNKRGGQRIFDGDQARARETVVLFLHKVRNNFPKVVIDETITDPACLGTHTRAPLEESQEQFNPRECWISLNAQRVKDMVSASVSGGRPFRTFQFIFTIVFIHEVGAHVLITLLGKGQELTPQKITAPGFTKKYTGESGRWLEQNLYGGTIELIEDPDQDSRTQA